MASEQQRSPARATTDGKRQTHRQQQQRFMPIRDGGSPGSPLPGSRVGSRTPQHPQQHQQQHQLVQCSSWGPATAEAAAGVADALSGTNSRADLRLFSRPLSESSLPDDLRQVLASAAATTSAHEAAGSSDSSRARLAFEHQPQHQHRPGGLLITGRQDMLGSSAGGSPASSRLGGVRASPFLGYNASALAAAAAEHQPAASTSSISASRLASQSSVASVGMAVGGTGASAGGHDSVHEEPGAVTTSPQRPRPSPFTALGNVPPGLID